MKVTQIKQTERENHPSGDVKKLHQLLAKLNPYRWALYSAERTRKAAQKTIADVFKLACRKAGIQGRSPQLSTASFRRPGGEQRQLFE